MNRERTGFFLLASLSCKPNPPPIAREWKYLTDYNFAYFGYGRYLLCNASQSPRLWMGRDQSTTMWRQRMLLWLEHLRRYLVFLWKHLRLASSFNKWQHKITGNPLHQPSDMRRDPEKTASSLEQWQNITVCHPAYGSLDQRPLSDWTYGHILTFNNFTYFYLYCFFCSSTMDNTALLCTLLTWSHAPVSALRVGMGNPYHFKL